jgi:hypothetical protein
MRKAGRAKRLSKTSTKLGELRRSPTTLEELPAKPDEARRAPGEARRSSKSGVGALFRSTDRDAQVMPAAYSLPRFRAGENVHCFTAATTASSRSEPDFDRRSRLTTEGDRSRDQNPHHHEVVDRTRAVGHVGLDAGCDARCLIDLPLLEERTCSRRWRLRGWRLWRDGSAAGGATSAGGGAWTGATTGAGRRLAVLGRMFVGVGVPGDGLVGVGVPGDGRSASFPVTA